jgi:hypothetical protein
MLQKMYQREVAEKRREEECDKWFNQDWPMMKVMHTWREKWLARQENSDSSDGSHDEEEKDKLRTKRHDGGASQQGTNAIEVNMVFVILVEFCTPENDVAELVLGAERAVSEKLEKTDEHMRPLFIKGI